MRWHELLRHLPHVSAAWQQALTWGDWALAAVWCVRTRTVMVQLSGVPDLTGVEWDLCPVEAPGVVVAVPARDEAKTIGPAMATLLSQDYPWMRILVVDDQSTDATGRIADELAAQHPDRMAVVHLSEPADGWVAKTFAMEVAASRSQSRWLLLTEADVWFSPSLLRRAVSFAERSAADHLVIATTVLAEGWAAEALLGFLGVLGLWLVPPWRVGRGGAAWDLAAPGAFHLVRRESWEELGGMAPQRLAVAESVTLSRRMRAAGMRQQMVFAPGIVVLARPRSQQVLASVGRLLCSVSNYRLWIAACAIPVFGLVILAPLAGLGWWPTLVPSVLVLACLGVQYRALAEAKGDAAFWGWLYPLGALLFLWSYARSMAVTLWTFGVRWRGTLYPLGALRQWNNPLRWDLEAAKNRAERRSVERGTRQRR